MLSKLKIIKRKREEIVLYFQPNETLLVNKSLSYSIAEDTFGITDIDILANFLENSEKRVKVT